MATTYLASPAVLIAATSKNVAAVKAAVAAANAEYAECNYSHSFEVLQSSTGIGVNMNDCGSLYSHLPEAFHGEWKAAIDEAMTRRVWMNSHRKNGYRMLGEVFKGSLANLVGHIGWCPGAKRTVGVTYACFGPDGSPARTRWDTMAEFKTLAQAQAFMVGLAAKHPAASYGKVA